MTSGKMMFPDSPSCAPGSGGENDEFVVRTDDDLIAEGWTRRNMSDPKCAQETVAQYEALGFEVRVESLKPEDFDAKCAACALSVCSSYVVIYTRKKAST